MGWIIFFIISILVFFLINPFEKLGQLWFVGIISMVVNYAIDSTLIALGAFSYRFANSLIGGLPTFYWLSSYFGGIVLVRFYPQKSLWKFPYILVSSFIFILLELIMNFLGYFYYHNWSPINSFLLNIIGFIVVIWLWSWINKIRMSKNAKTH